MAVIVPAPPMSQGSEVDLLVDLAGSLDPEFVQQHGTQLSLVIDDAAPTDDLIEVTRQAHLRFDRLVGAARVFTDTGVLRAGEANPGVGAVVDEDGNQYIMLAPVLGGVRFPGEAQAFGHRVRAVLDRTPALGEALQLFGRSGASAAEFYMIQELAQGEFGGIDGVRAALGISKKLQRRFRRSANATPSEKGGRHAAGETGEMMTVEDQRMYLRDLLFRWIQAELHQLDA